ncbi:hypothetical protein GGX14DRAFT_374888, partial [Mycena pura]
FSGSAVAVERIFSGGRDTIALRRTRLSADTIRTLMLVKHHLKLKRKTFARCFDAVLKKMAEEDADVVELVA